MWQHKLNKLQYAPNVYTQHHHYGEKWKVFSKITSQTFNGLAVKMKLNDLLS